MLAALLASQAGAEEPLSAIDWLNTPGAVPIAAPRTPVLNEPPTAQGVTVPEVTVMPLDSAGHEAVGLLPSSVTGLPGSLWSASAASDLSALWRRASAEPLPAIQALYYSLLLAEAEPPRDAGGAFLGARVAALMRLGAVEPALALVERAGPGTPQLFGAYFDLALLSGEEVAACQLLRDAPALRPGYATQIYCTALNGDWQTAMLLFDTANALGMLTRTETQLLAQFLDPEMVETAIGLAPVSHPSPLLFRLYEAAGTPLPTRNLPLAFAIADLRGDSGWKAELEAAERLVRTGALSENRLLGLYTDQRPAASGGVWERVAAVQALDRALETRDNEAVAKALPAAWRLMQQQRLEVAFATLFSERLSQIELPPRGAALAFRMKLLTPEYEAATPGAGASRDERFLASIARGAPDAALAGAGVEQAIARAFATPPRPAPDLARLIDAGKLGEAILSAANRADQADGDLRDIAESLATLRALGLEDTARRAALQMLILERSE
ncbi:hypothetical protein D6850_09410 [Roseovarius spongiae]|uniref:Uncharacterized protein n=1 Tax=Roseovarius spongiae TaxID=2320272 RepID=A0A3A8B9U0_9RHOB|nr:hypothetical protein D6850_09410 [Roseovarius spongiae]